MKTLLLVALLAFPSFAQTARYDKFKDITFISADEARIGHVRMEAKALHPGEKLVKSGDLQCYLVFRSSSRSWLFLRSRDLIFLADGERIALGAGSHDGDVSSARYNSVGVTERMIYTITRADLEKLVAAKSLEMKLGYLEAKLEEKDKKGMQEILQYK